MSQMRQNKEMRALIRALTGQRFTVETRHGRSATCCKVTSPSVQVVIIPALGTRTEARALLNARAALRRIGADV